VLLPAPDERPALKVYQEAGQFLGCGLRICFETVFIQNSECVAQKQAKRFACKLCKIHFLHIR
jgi:hypothetical protein